MAQPVFYQTMNNVGIDPTVYYAVSASVTPETPAPPFLVGTRAFGSDGSEFVFVQASTSISLTDFVVLNSGQAVSPFQANSVTNTNVVSSLAVALASTGLVLKQSVTFIPAAAFFWALTRGTFVPATTSNGLASNAGGVTLFTGATAGVLTSATAGAATAAAFAGIVCVNSLTVSIANSIVPPVGTLTSTGFTVGPVVTMNVPRTVIFSSLLADTPGGSLGVFW
jgi:hypothetical protein